MDHTISNLTDYNVGCKVEALCEVDSKEILAKILRSVYAQYKPMHILQKSGTMGAFVQVGQYHVDNGSSSSSAVNLILNLISPCTVLRAYMVSIVSITIQKFAKHQSFINRINTQYKSNLEDTLEQQKLPTLCKKDSDSVVIQGFMHIISRVHMHIFPDRHIFTDQFLDQSN